MILKIQRSIEPIKEWSDVLIYNRDRTVKWQGAMTPELNKLFKKPHEYKIFHAGFVLDGKIHLQERVKHHKW